LYPSHMKKATIPATTRTAPSRNPASTLPEPPPLVLTSTAISRSVFDGPVRQPSCRIDVPVREMPLAKRMILGFCVGIRAGAMPLPHIRMQINLLDHAV